jgi:hypothetical protein
MVATCIDSATVQADAASGWPPGGPALARPVISAGCGKSSSAVTRRLPIPGTQQHRRMSFSDVPQFTDFTDRQA